MVELVGVDELKKQLEEIQKRLKVAEALEKDESVQKKMKEIAKVDEEIAKTEKKLGELKAKRVSIVQEIQSKYGEEALNILGLAKKTVKKGGKKGGKVIYNGMEFPSGKALCDYLGIDTGGDSAFRVLDRHGIKYERV